MYSFFPEYTLELGPFFVVIGIHLDQFVRIVLPELDLLLQDNIILRFGNVGQTICVRG